MSVKAMKWAMSICEIAGDLKTKHRAVLMALAWHHTDKGCFPSQKALSRLSGVRERGLRDVLADLEAHGLIKRSVKRTGGKFQKTEYELFGSYHHRQTGAAGTTGKKKPVVTTGRRGPHIGSIYNTPLEGSADVVFLDQRKDGFCGGAAS